MSCICRSLTLPLCNVNGLNLNLNAEALITFSTVSLFTSPIWFLFFSLFENSPIWFQHADSYFIIFNVVLFLLLSCLVSLLGKQNQERLCFASNPFYCRMPSEFYLAVERSYRGYLHHKLYSALLSTKAWIDGSLPRKSDRSSTGSLAPPAPNTCQNINKKNKTKLTLTTLIFIPDRNSDKCEQIPCNS